MVSFTLVNVSVPYYTTENKKTQIPKGWYKMNTLNKLTAGIVSKINEQTINDLISTGFDHDRAVKVVTEFDDFDLVQDSIDNEVTEF